MTFIRNRYVVATIVAASAIALPASAMASPAIEPLAYNSDAAQSGSADSPRPVGSLMRTAKATFPPAHFRGGDAPVEHPGASRAPSTAPTTIEVVRPVPTIVRDVDQALPLLLSSTALLLALAAVGIALARTRMLPRPSRSH